MEKQFAILDERGRRVGSTWAIEAKLNDHQDSFWFIGRDGIVCATAWFGYTDITTGVTVTVSMPTKEN